MQKTKIDWADFTWNPAWGCLNHCLYCYARKMALRHGDTEFKPRWMEKNFNRAFPRKTSSIFVNSMSDIGFWEKDWMDKVLIKIRQYPQHRFLFLTKLPKIYGEFSFPDNCWRGITITTQKEMDWLADYLFSTTHIDEPNLFLSIEPILTPIKLYIWPDWLIVGAETGRYYRKDKVIPQKDWVDDLVKECRVAKIPIFMKSSLRAIYSDLIQELPD